MAEPLLQLNAALLANLDQLEINAKHLVNGFLQGLHRSAMRGVSQEFVAYRPYISGDALKDVDWNVWARSDHLFIRQFRHESNFRGYLFLDCSKSMDYGKAEQHKFSYARLLTACISALMLRQLDAVGLQVIGKQNPLEFYVEPSTRSNQLEHICAVLEKLQADGKQDQLGDCLDLVDSCRSRSMAVIISDAFVPHEQLKSLLEQLRMRDIDVLFFHILCPEELALDLSGEIVLKDSETGRDIVVDSAKLKPHYQQRLQDFLQQTTKMCHDLEVHYCQLSTDKPLDVALYEFINLRDQH